MGRFRKLGTAVVFAGFIATGMMTFNTTLHAQTFDPAQLSLYCQVLDAAAEKAASLGLGGFAKYLQSIYAAYCSSNS
jgi:hypothetical protein